MMEAARALFGDVFDSTSEKVTNGLSNIAKATLVKASFDPSLYQNLAHAGDMLIKVELSSNIVEIIAVIKSAQSYIDQSAVEQVDNPDQNFSLLVSFRNTITILNKHILAADDQFVTLFNVKQLMRCLLICNLTHVDFLIQDAVHRENPLNHENILKYFHDTYPDIFDSEITLPSIATNVLKYAHVQQARNELEGTDCPHIYSLLTAFPVLEQSPYANKIMTSKRKDLNLSVRLIQSIIGIICPPDEEVTLPRDTDHATNLQRNAAAFVTQAVKALAGFILTILAIMSALFSFVLYMATNISIIQTLGYFTSMLTFSVITLAASCYLFIAPPVIEKLTNIQTMRPATSASTKPSNSIISLLTRSASKACTSIKVCFSI